MTSVSWMKRASLRIVMQRATVSDTEYQSCMSTLFKMPPRRWTHFCWLWIMSTFRPNSHDFNFWRILSLHFAHLGPFLIKLWMASSSPYWPRHGVCPPGNALPFLILDHFWSNIIPIFYKAKQNSCPWHYQSWTFQCYFAFFNLFRLLQVWESIPHHLPKLSRPPSLADVHFPHYSDLPKPDLAKKLNSLHAQFSALPKSLKSLTPSSGEEPKNMEGIANKLKRKGWCWCLRDDEPPEITYCVVDGAGTLSLQAVTPSVPMPDEDELNAKFAELVVRLKLP